MESGGFHASVDHMGEYHSQYFDGDKQAICIFCLKETIDLSEEEVAAGGQKNLFAFASDVTLEKNLRA